MKTAKNRSFPSIRLAASALVVALLTACTSPFAGDGAASAGAPGSGESPETVVTIHIGGLAPQSIVPDVASLVASYQVTLSRSGYTSVSDSGTSGPFTFANLAVGTWNVAVVAYDGGSNPVGEGTGTVEVLAGGTGSTTVHVAPTASGSGSMSVTIDWSSAPGAISAVQHATVTPAGQSLGPDVSGAFSVSGNAATYTNSSAVSGQYTLVVRLEDAGGTHVATVVEAVHVYDNVETAGTINLGPGDIAQPPAAPTIASAAETTSGSGNVLVSWNDNSNVEETYKVWRSADGGSTWTETWDVGANTTSYTNENLTEGTTYTYRVTAENSFGFTEDTTSATTASLSVYYVSSSSGADANHGGSNWPVATIGEALSRASGGHEIRVAGGTYDEALTVDKAVSIYGSYDIGFSSRSLEPPTSVLETTGNAYATVVFDEIGETLTNAVVFDGFDVRNAGTKTSSFTYALSVEEGAPTISNNHLTGWNGVSQFAGGVTVGSSRGAAAVFDGNYIVGSYDGPWTITVRAYGDASAVFRNNEIYGVLDGGSGGGTDYTYLARPSTTGKLTFVNNYMDLGVSSVTGFANLRGLALEGETDADIFGNVITAGESPSSTSAMLPIQIGSNGVDADGDQVDEPLNVRIYGNTIYTGTGGGQRRGIDIVQSTGNIEIVNNIVVTTPGSTAEWVEVQDPAIGTPVRLENNAFSGPGAYQLGQLSLTTASQLNTAGTATATTSDPAGGNVIAGVSFTDAAAGDFTLDGNTPSAVGEGGLDLSSMSGFPTTDLGGTSRTAPWAIGAYEFDGPFATGSVEVNITFDDPNDPDVSFSGITDGSSIVKGTDVTLTAPGGYATYTWYLNGTPADTTGLNSGGQTATLKTAVIPYGAHAVSLVVGDGSNLYSAQVEITVTQ